SLRPLMAGSSPSLPDGSNPSAAIVQSASDVQCSRLLKTTTGRGVGLKVLTGHGAAIDTTTAAGKLVFGIFAALAEFERELIAERTVAGLASARARGRKGGRPFKMTAAKLRLAMASMGQPETKVSDLCEELGITRQTLYRHVSPKGELRPDGVKLLSRGSTS
ncbi:recombinase family protein, partial [Pseudomonas aeruginosa]